MFVSQHKDLFASPSLMESLCHLQGIPMLKEKQSRFKMDDG